MRWNIIGNITNAYGLQGDYQLLRDLLHSWGHEVNGIQYDNPVTAQPADRNLWLEDVNPRLFPLAREQWIFPNPEWLYAAWIPNLDQFCRHWVPDLLLRRWISHSLSRRFRYVLCKTGDCERIFRAFMPPDKLVFTGFMARDLYEPAIPKTRSFLHVAGKSKMKNTEAIIQAWKEWNIPWQLTIVSTFYSGPPIPNVTFYDRLSDEELRVMMNTNLFHLCPSMYEGYGHALHEGMGCGAIVITVDRPPMNDFGCPSNLYVRPNSIQDFDLATLQVVPASEIHEAVKRATALTEEECTRLSGQARAVFCKDNETFVQRFNELI
jgi:glycosyl transferase family 1